MLRHPSQTMLVLTLVAGLGLGVLATGVAADSPAAAASPQIRLVQGPLNTSTFAKLAEAVKPAVINVNTQRASQGRSRLEEFFGGQLPGPFRDRPEGPLRRGVGSGVIIDPTGIALTNAHVVEGAKDVEVTVLDGSKHRATVIGLDTKTDLAVLKLEGAKPFPFLKLGDSDEVRVGDWVLAVGSPFGLQATVTSGIVSAKARHIGAGSYDDFLQTDAAINPGNSGGPLVNMRGEVVGINTVIVRGGSGIGFAIPSNMAKRISGELLAGGTVRRGWLGVSIQPLTPELAQSFGIKDRKGALIAEVQPDSPAAKAGLRSGDIVIRFQDKRVEDSGDLARLVGMAKPDEDARLTVLRDGAEKTLAVKLGSQPGERAAARLGLKVQPVTAEIARELSLGTAQGVVVTSVESGSAAERAGIRRGDVIREVERKPIKTVADFERATATPPADRPLTVRLERDGASLYVALPAAKSAG